MTLGILAKHELSIVAVNSTERLYITKNRCLLGLTLAHSSGSPPKQKWQA